MEKLLLKNRSAGHRPRRRILIAVMVLGVLASGPASAVVEADPDPFPVGACVRSTMVDRRPICVIVDPQP